MKTSLKILETVENRVRNIARMKAASKDIDQKRRKAPRGWRSVEIIRQIREGRN